MKSVGIDIGSSSIKIAEVVQTNKGLTLTSFREHHLGQNPAFDSEIEILEFLRNLAPQYPSESWKIVVGLRQEKVSVRNKIFPFSDRLKILKSLPFELEEDLPYSPEDAIYDAKIIRIMGQSAEVLACATPKSKVAELVEKMNDVGLGISILSAEGVALANCLENWTEPPASTPGTQIQIEGEARPERNIDILVHIGHTRTLVCAFDSSCLVGVRSIFWGAKNIAESITRKYEMTYVQALKELKKAFILLNQSGASYDHVIFSNCIAESIRELVRELRVTLLEFQSELNGKLTGVMLSGGGSQIQNLHAYLTTQLEVPVNLFSPLSLFPNVAFERTPEVEFSCAVAVGYAIEGLRKPKNPPLNLLKLEFQKHNRRVQELWQAWGSVIKLAAAAFVIFSVYSVIREQMANTLSDSISETVIAQGKAVAKLPAKQATESGVKKFIKEQRKKAQSAKSIENLAKMNSAMDILRKVSDAVPGKTSLTLNVKRVSILNNRLEIEGTVAKAQELPALQQALQQISISNKVEILKPMPSGAPTAQGVPFAYALPVDRNFSSGGSK